MLFVVGCWFVGCCCTWVSVVVGWCWLLMFGFGCCFFLQFVVLLVVVVVMLVVVAVVS